ncbi:hypothetical protein D9611_013430 [Ephemerocybe angulata]|uniref:CHAT domain-containing protein n=1 Tax=Ephemerocybe angulata TaxID=980116 RepID=A0A8H5BWW8_9AGAR|nr:hypothetical protein D9611_013430 [Tulosesus angulatus]
MLIRRFEWTGELADLAESISVRQRAVEFTPMGHADLPSYLNNLGNSFSHRFGRTGELSDLSEAISAQQAAVEGTPQGSIDLPSRLNNLGGSLARRFERSGKLSDITEAISAQKRAVELTPQGHANLPSYLSNLGHSLFSHSQRTGDVSGLTEAISAQQRAVELTPQGQANLPSYLSNLGSSLSLRFERTEDLPDINKAISVRQSAVEHTPKGHVNLPAYLENLGHSFTLRFLSRLNDQDLRGALSSFKDAAIAPVGPPRVKLQSAKRWARTLIQFLPHSPEIVLAFDTALALIGLIAGFEQTLRGRYSQIQDIAGLAPEAAAAACGLDRGDKALEWLEQGRCLVLGQLNALRTPLDDLRAHDEELAQSIANVAKQLDDAGSRAESQTDMSLTEKITLHDEARAHLDLTRQWEELLKTARTIPSLESFLMPMPCSALMQHLPDSGPIVVINVYQHRCDALALFAGRDKPLLIPLPSFSLEKASAHRAILDCQLRTRNLRVREVDVDTTIDEFSARGMRPVPLERHIEDPPVHRVLRSLWEELVKPILDAIGFSRVDRAIGEMPPRLWWCPTGPLSFLPLHAAGIYRGANREGVSDYAVSSYTPTVSTITDRVKNLRSFDADASGLFLTSHPNVSNASSIPGTTTEVRSIFKRAEESGVRALKLEGDEMSVAECLERMQSFSSIHLACHGSQNAAEPLQSRFLFHKGSLELGTILKLNLKNADLAFLSACQTSTGEEKLSDEAVHLAAGMLAAGYRRVVGTMWSIGDQAGQDVATNFYEYLFTHRDGTSDGAFDGTLSAHALDHATQQLRRRLDDSEHSLFTWIPFVHFGY